MAQRRHITVGTVLATLALAAVAGCGTSGSSTYPAANVDHSTVTLAPDNSTVAPMSDQDKLIAWRDGGGAAILLSFSADLEAIQQAGTAADTNGMEQADIKLAADVDKAQAYQPQPIPELQAEWAQVLQSMNASAHDGITGASNLDVALIEQSTAELDDATSHLKVLTELTSKYASS